MAKVKKLFSIIILLITLSFSTSCITLAPNEEKQIINDFTSNAIISATFSINVYKQVGLKEERVAQGSGVIFSKQEYYGNVNTFYLLTNNHVVSNGVSYTVSDCYGKEIPATLVKNDSNYDLAILKFNSSEDYKILNFVSSDVQNGDKVIAVGTPNGQLNAVTFGKVQKYSFVTVEGGELDSNVNFKVIEHNAPIYSGSSGGVLLNYSFEICGINYATYIENEKFVLGYAISASKVLEFING